MIQLHSIEGESSERRVRVLDVDPDLGVELDRRSAYEARAALVAPVSRIQWRTHRGQWGPAEPRGHVGVLIIDGLILREVCLVGAASAEVLGQGDLLRPWDIDGHEVMPLSEEVSWTVLSPASVAVLDATFLRRAARWPQVLSALMGRAVVRARSLALHDAITNAKHVETRLLVQFWHLAERWGRVGPEGISLVVPLTHEMLAKLVGATRPSVSTALGRLAERGLLLRDARGVWLVSRDIPGALGEIASQPATTVRP